MDLNLLAQQLGNVEHFKGITPEAIKLIIAAGQIRRFTAGEILFFEEEPTSGLYVLLGGRVQLCKLSPQGQISILAIFEPVIMFNEVSALDGGPSPATAIALEDSLVWNLAPEHLEELLLKHPRVALGMLRVMAARNRRLIGHFQDLSFRPVLARAAKLLLELSANGQKPIDRRRHPNHQLAAQISTVPEAFSRSLKAFRCNQWIQTEERTIQVLKPEQLAHVAEISPAVKEK